MKDILPFILMLFAVLILFSKTVQLKNEIRELKLEKETLKYERDECRNLWRVAKCTN